MKPLDAILNWGLVHHCQLIPVEIWASEAKEAGHIKPIESITLIQFSCLWYCCNFGYGCPVLYRHVLITLAMKLEVPTCFSLPTVNMKCHRNCCPSSVSTSWLRALSALSSPGWDCQSQAGGHLAGMLLVGKSFTCPCFIISSVPPLLLTLVLTSWSPFC